MCDTMVALGNATKDGSVIFAKNSDRQPNEPHVMIRVPRQRYPKGKRLACSYIEIDQAEETHEVLLLKPSWIWGAEMGSNEYGLTIGNEAVFTRETYGEPSLLGMDMLRIALERCKTSDEALNMITQLLETYGQGGNCGYQKKFTYHNSFLIADRDSAWVLEMAGEYWVAEKVRDIRSISNALSIGQHYDKHHPDVVKHAIEKGWCKGEEDFHFAKCYTSPLFTYFSKARKRRGTSMNTLEGNKGNITVNTMKGILRSHVKDVEGKQFSTHSINSVCMHGGFLYGDHTTGSYIARLNHKMDIHWVTGSSTPCISIFKPFCFIDGEQLSFTEEELDPAIHYWKGREKLHRMFIENRIRDVKAYTLQRDELEREIEKDFLPWEEGTIDFNRWKDGINEIREKEDRFVSGWIQEGEKIPAVIKGSPYYRRYWKKQTQDLFHG